MEGRLKTVDTGVQIIGGTISELIDDVMVNAYQTVQYKKWRFGGTHSTTAYADAGDDVSNQISLVFNSLADTVYSGGMALGLSSDDLTDAIQNFVVDTTNISLAGMSTAEQTEALSNYFSAIYNSMVGGVIPWLEALQDTGEELGDTLARVAGEVAVLNFTVQNMGVIASGSAEDIAGYADGISDLIGGYADFTDAISSFYDSFATDSQKFDLYSSTLTDALSELGLSLPSTTSGFYDLLSGLDASTDSGQYAIATILSLTDTASAYYDLLEDSESTLQAINDERASLLGDLADELGDEDYARQVELNTLDDTNKSLQLMIYALKGRANRS